MKSAQSDVFKLETSLPKREIQTSYRVCFHSVPSFRSQSDPKLRKRNPAAPETPTDRGDVLDGCVGVGDRTSSTPNKSQQQQQEEEKRERSCPAPGVWSPLTANVCLCTVLVLGAYVCYRVYFHWCLSFFSPFFLWFFVVVVVFFVPRCPKVDSAGQSAWSDSLGSGRRSENINGRLPLFTQTFSVYAPSWTLRASLFQVPPPKRRCVCVCARAPTRTQHKHTSVC